MAEYAREVYLSWLSSAGLSPENMGQLLEASEGDLRALYRAGLEGGREMLGIPLPEKAAGALQRNGRPGTMDAWARLIERTGIRALCLTDDAYPEVLRPLEDPPAVLFYLGNPGALDRPSAAVVGSRSASWKALNATEKISAELSENGIAIISGLAYGVDAAAHKGCLKGQSPTVAVMGCGLEQDYPRENARLKQQILESGGLILSEFAPGEKPLGWHFPIRNRIISGLADCLLVMEARIRSGSMTTVQHALQQGKDIFVHPGEPGSLQAEGNHQLLREGAIYFTCAEDVMEDMRWLDKKREVGQNSGYDPAASLNAEERVVYSCLLKGEQSFDELCGALDMTAGPLMSLLTMMQIKGAVEAMPGKIYRIKAE